MTHRQLVVGDPHVTEEELADAGALLEHVDDIARQRLVDSVLFLGDLYHTHAIVHVEVMAFWREHLAWLAEEREVIVLLGNHDMPGNSASSAHALLTHKDQRNVVVIDEPVVHRGVGYVPYSATNGEFLERAAALEKAPTLVCHQTFNGSRFDNGLYAPNGADSNLLRQEFVISGHIHLPQTFGKVWYPGAPRWRTLSDANIERAIWVVTYSDDGRVLERQSFSTAGICREIRFAKVTPELHEGQVVPAFDPRPPRADDENVDWRFDIEGPREFVDGVAKLLRGPGRKVRTFITDAPQARVKESMGIAQAFREWLRSSGVPRFGTPLPDLERLAMERLGWQ